MWLATYLSIYFKMDAPLYTFVMTIMTTNTLNSPFTTYTLHLFIFLDYIFFLFILLFFLSAVTVCWCVGGRSGEDVVSFDVIRDLSPLLAGAIQHVPSDCQSPAWTEPWIQTRVTPVRDNTVYYWCVNTGSGAAALALFTHGCAKGLEDEDLLLFLKI